MPGPRPKADAQRQRRNTPTKAAPGSRMLPAGVAQLPLDPPAPTKHWRAATKRGWAAVWTHPIMAAVDRALHEPELRRLFDLRDEREIIAAIVRASPVVEGSQGQERMHPLYARLSTVETELRNLEDRNGLNPKSMADLGISFAGAKKSLDDLAEGLENDPTEECDDETDPRIVEATAVVTPRRSPKARRSST